MDRRARRFGSREPDIFICALLTGKGAGPARDSSVGAGSRGDSEGGYARAATGVTAFGPADRHVRPRRLMIPVLMPNGQRGNPFDEA